jgi:hypothetical protein
VVLGLQIDAGDTFLGGVEQQRFAADDDTGFSIAFQLEFLGAGALVGAQRVGAALRANPKDLAFVDVLERTMRSRSIFKSKKEKTYHTLFQVPVEPITARTNARRSAW